MARGITSRPKNKPHQQAYLRGILGQSGTPTIPPDLESLSTTAEPTEPDDVVDNRPKKKRKKKRTLARSVLEHWKGIGILLVSGIVVSGILWLSLDGRIQVAVLTEKVENLSSDVKDISGSQERLQKDMMAVTIDLNDKLSSKKNK